MKGEIVGEHELQGLADDGEGFTLIVSIGGLEDLGQEGGALEVIVHPMLEVAIDMSIEILGQHLGGDTVDPGGVTGGGDLEIERGLVDRFDPVDSKALVISDGDLTSGDG